MPQVELHQIDDMLHMRSLKNIARWTRYESSRKVSRPQTKGRWTYNECHLHLNQTTDAHKGGSFQFDKRRISICVTVDSKEGGPLSIIFPLCKNPMYIPKSRNTILVVLLVHKCDDAIRSWRTSGKLLLESLFALHEKIRSCSSKKLPPVEYCQSTLCFWTIITSLLPLKPLKQPRGERRSISQIGHVANSGLMKITLWNFNPFLHDLSKPSRIQTQDSHPFYWTA